MNQLMDWDDDPAGQLDAARSRWMEHPDDEDAQEAFTEALLAGMKETNEHKDAARKAAILEELLGQPAPRKEWQKGQYFKHVLVDGGSVQHMAQAFDHVQTLLADAAENPRMAKPAAWLLRHIVVCAMKNLMTDKAREMLELWHRLEINDELLGMEYTRLDAHLNKGGDDPRIAQAKQLHKQGNYRESQKAWVNLAKAHPDNEGFAKQAAWETFHCLKTLGKDAHAVADLESILYTYAAIPNPVRPSDVHSIILSFTLRLGEGWDRLGRFVGWWNVAFLREEDFQRKTADDGTHTFPSLMEQLISALYKWAKTHRGVMSEYAWFIPLFRSGVERFPDQLYFAYYIGNLHVWMGQREKARQYLLPFLRRKKADFWAWHGFAEALDPDSHEQRLACLCRAMLCAVEDDAFLVKIRRELIDEFLHAELHAPAHFELDAIGHTCQLKGWKVKNDIELLMLHPWYRESEPASDNDELYRHHAQRANDIMAEGLPWIDANVVHVADTDPSKPAISVIGWNEDGKYVSVPLKHKTHQVLTTIPKGAAIRFRAFVEQGRTVVVVVETRPGEPWDALPILHGVVVHHDPAAGQSFIVHASCLPAMLVHHSRISTAADFPPGSFVHIAWSEDPKTGNKHAHAMRATDAAPPEGYYRVFRGRITRGGANAFLDDCFIPPALVPDSIEESDFWEVPAALQYEKRKDRYGWKAVAVPVSASSAGH